MGLEIMKGSFPTPLVWCTIPEQRDNITETGVCVTVTLWIL